MSQREALNRLRWRAILTARSMKDLFRPGAVTSIGGRLLAWLLIAFRRVPGVRGWAYRATFTVDGEKRRIVADHVLADLRDFTFAQKPAFDRDPIIMARLQGRRDVWLRITNYLNLDEAQAQAFMEIDDGI